MKPWPLVLLLLTPAVAAQEAPFPRVENLSLLPGNQIIHATWDPVADGSVIGYTVFVYGEDGFLRSDNTIQPRYTFGGAINGRTYIVEVAARDEEGRLGPRAAATTQPRLEEDLTYLTVGLVFVWVALWAYALVLARRSRELANRLEGILLEMNRLRKTP